MISILLLGALLEMIQRFAVRKRTLCLINSRPGNRPARFGIDEHWTIEERLSRIGMFHVIIFASIFGARKMTGILLPMLIIGDLLAIRFFGSKAQWSHIRKMLPPTLVGIGIGWVLMRVVADDRQFKPLVGGIVLGLAMLQMLRTWRSGWFDHVPHQRWFAWSLGLSRELQQCLPMRLVP